VSEASGFVPTPRERNPTVLAGEIAGQQWGVIGWRQLQGCGVSSSVAGRWRSDGKLHPIHVGVYALGHPSVPIEGRLVAALIHAGPDAVLSYTTAAWWWELIKDEPSTIDVSAPGYSSSTTCVRVHHPRHREATTHRRFPITTVPRTLLDLAASTTLNRVRVALAQADYRRILDVAAVESILGQGRSGSAKLRRALEHHQPRLALTRSGLEIAFFSLCEAARLPVPEVNARVDGWEVDVLWREHRLAVEVDGGRNHSTRGQIERDRRKELHLRAGGFQVIRYTDRQVADEPEIVASDVRRALNLTAPSA
jgi:very-short-patch-repair endonuclease